MKALIDALETISTYNQIPIDEFIERFEKFFRKKLKDSEIECIKDAGLSNKDIVKFRKSFKYKS